MEHLQRLFKSWSGEDCQQCSALGGGGSARRYFRLASAHHHCIGAYATDLRENEAFFAYSHHLRAKGMPVPQLYAVADDRCHYLQEDLGDQSLYGLLFDKKRHGQGFDHEMLTLYQRALADLDALQRAGSDMDFSVAMPRTDFDQRSMMWDLNYFKYHFLKLAHIPFDEERLENDFEHLTAFLLEADCRYFLYRDFQGRNIMVQGEGAEATLRYIDYQGGRRGAAQYDVASLLYSAKSDVPEAVRHELLRYYADLHGDPHFMHHFWGYALLRILQTLGAYGYRGLYERKPYFLESIPLALANLRRLMHDHPLPIDWQELPRLVAHLEPTMASSTSDEGLTVQVMSFSYKQGLPDDRSGNGGGHVFDCRALPNPGRYAEYQSLTGKDPSVAAFLRKEESVGRFLDHAKALVGQSIDVYLSRHFTHLQVAFGCTGGQHRSVYCAEQMAKWIASRYPSVCVRIVHREQDPH